MATEPSNDLREEFLRGFGRRLRQAVYDLREDKGSRDELHSAAAAVLKNSPDTFRRWYGGQNAPDVWAFYTLLSMLDPSDRSGYDANYILMGQETQRESSPIEEIRRDVNHVLRKVNELSDLSRDNQLGLEGVVMRLSLAMLEDLRKTRSRTAPEEFREPVVAGILQDKLVAIVEEHAVRVRVVTLRLDYGVDRDTSTDEEQLQAVRAGRFFNTMLHNISKPKPCKYEFVLHRDARYKIDPKEYMKKLREAAGNKRAVRSQVQFCKTTLPLGAGFVLLDLDLVELEREHPALADELKKDYILIDDKKKNPILGEVMAPSPKMHACALMDRERVEDALRAWDQYMRDAQWLEL